MTRENKYIKYKSLFESYFIYFADTFKVSGSGIPIAKVNFDNMSGDTGDGTINLALYLQYQYTRYLLGEIHKADISKSAFVLERLCTQCYDMFKEKCPNVYFKEEPGFFLRDDIKSSDAEAFNLKSIRSGYSSGIERIEEDPCFSPFVSQDQIWNLLPILSTLAGEGNLYCKNLINRILEYVVRNNHTIYNPYYSALYHNWTYLHIFEPYSERIPERNRKLKYTIKVKRGANNWYFAYGFRKVFNKFGGNSKTFWKSLWYKPFIFLADRVYHPYICKWFKLPVKNTSYYSLAVAGGAWYGGDYEKRIIKKFNKSLEEGSDLFNPELVFLTSRRDEVNLNLLGKWLDNYPNPVTSGSMDSPLLFMTLYNWHRIAHDKIKI